MNAKYYAILFMVIICLEVNAFENLQGQDTIKTSRYTRVENVPTDEQLNPLRVVIKTKIPQNVDSVRRGVEFLLLRSGYEIADEAVMSDEVKRLMNLPLPVVHRALGPVTLDKALQALVGDSYKLVVDPIHRLISFELVEELEVLVNG